ncbi:hypothetical protein ACFL7M_19165, partial [Thermodesulfobacteriota bacterium]
MERTLHALEDFILTAEEYGVKKIRAVSTGVVRRAINRNLFLALIHNRTGIDVLIISGEKEARFTREGVLHALNIDSGASVIFDLGGGTTEFISGYKDNSVVRSVPLGAMVLTQKFLGSDTPGQDKIEKLSEYTDKILNGALPRKRYGENIRLVGSGGTVTTLAAMIKRIDIKDITDKRLNGLILERGQIEDLFTHMKSISISERLRLPGLDRARAGAILAGAVTVIRILYFFHSERMTVSYSDILEGILISYLQGEYHE